MNQEYILPLSENLPKKLIANLSLISLVFFICSSIRLICLGGLLNANLFDHFTFRQSMMTFLDFYFPLFPFGLVIYALYVKTKIEREHKRYEPELPVTSIPSTKVEQKPISRFTFFMAKYGISIASLFFIVHLIYQLKFRPEYYFLGQLAQSPGSQWQTLIITVIMPFGSIVAYTVFYVSNGVKLLPSLTKYCVPVFVVFFIMVNAFAEAQQIKIGFRTPKASIVLKNGKEIHTSDFLIYFAHSESEHLLYNRPQDKMISIPDESVDRDKTIINNYKLTPFFRM